MSAGEQAVINGALVTAKAPLQLRIGGGASVVRGARQLPPRQKQAAGYSLPAATLYYETLHFCAQQSPPPQQQKRLFQILGECVLQMRTRDAQILCSGYASAMRTGNFDHAQSAASGLACMERGNNPCRPNPQQALGELT